MTIQEAEDIYRYEVEAAKREITLKRKRALSIWNIISFILILSGIVLTIVGFTLPRQELYDGYEIDAPGALFAKIYGIGAMIVGVWFLIIFNISFRKAIQKGQIDFLPHVNKLYLNYLKCEDMKPEDKEFYRQKLEDIRNENLVNAINRASASTSAAIMFTMLRK